MFPTEIPPGLKFYPTDADIVKLHIRAAAGGNIGFIRRADVCSDHPSIIYGSSEPLNAERKVQLVWGDSLSQSSARSVGNGEFAWHDRGSRVVITEETSNMSIGVYHSYVLVNEKTGMETEWILREFMSYQHILCPHTLYEISSECKEFLKARELMQTARAALQKAYDLVSGRKGPAEVKGKSLID